jgi:hypothetical protein
MSGSGRFFGSGSGLRFCNFDVVDLDDFFFGLPRFRFTAPDARPEVAAAIFFPPIASQD